MLLLLFALYFQVFHHDFIEMEIVLLPFASF